MLSKHGYHPEKSFRGRNGASVQTRLGMIVSLMYPKLQGKLRIAESSEPNQSCTPLPLPIPYTEKNEQVH